LYYAFYAKNWSGEVELRGLADRTYKVIDYVNDKFISDVEGKNAKLNINFDKYFLIKAIPIN
jgi:alpha-galactosidase